MTVAEIEPDIVRSWREARGRTRSPLLVLEPLERYLDERGIGSGAIDARFIGDGHSNVTYLLARGDARVVLRRPPRPPLPPSTHDVLREARVLHALDRTGVPAPRVLHACSDTSVLGVPFYLMDEVVGEVITFATPPALAAPQHRREMGLALVDALARLHAVDWRERGLDGFGRDTGYLERQLRRFTALWDVNRTRDVPRVDALTAWLAREKPVSPPARLIHGDFRIGNVMFASGPPVDLRAIFDWEMATIGDPLADLGYLTATWADRGRPGNAMTDLAPVTREPGFSRAHELAEAYGELTGLSLRHLRWYQVLALWKSCVFLEGSYSRFLAGTSDDRWFALLGERVPHLAEAAWALATE